MNFKTETGHPQQANFLQTYDDDDEFSVSLAHIHRFLLTFRFAVCMYKPLYTTSDMKPFIGKCYNATVTKGIQGNSKRR
jgi:hypothetical protein